MSTGKKRRKSNLRVLNSEFLLYFCSTNQAHHFYLFVLRNDIFCLSFKFLLLAAYVIDPFYQEIQMPIWAKGLAVFLLLLGVAVIFFGVINLNNGAYKDGSSLKNTVNFFRGIYKYVRHPIYAGLLLVLLAVALYMGSWFKGSIALILVIAFYYKSNLEEKKLIEQYWHYQKYKDCTGRFFPKLNNLRSQ